MADVVFAIPGDLDTPTGGYAYGRRVLAELPACGVTVRHLALAASFPFPTARDLEATALALGGRAPNSVLLADGLAFGALPAVLVSAIRPPIAALVHHPLAYETGLSEARRQALATSERDALRFAQRVIASSSSTARLLAAEFDVAADKITVAEPGTDPADRARNGGHPPHLLAVGAVSPRKGYAVLIEALEGLTSHPWRLTIAGPLDRDKDTTSALRAAISSAGLEARITLAGAVDREPLAALYATADVFVMPSLFEGYGMALAEAMARGLPIVCTTGGAAAETVPDGAGLKVPPGDAAALGDALSRVLTDTSLHRQLADAAWAAGQRLPRWIDTARTIAGVIKQVQP